MPLRGPDDPMPWLAALEAGSPHAVKALDGLPWSGGATSGGSLPFWGDNRGPMAIGSGLLPSARANYAAKAGRLDKNAVVSIALGWVVKQAVRAKLQVTREDDDGNDDVVGKHAFTDFMRKPSPYYPSRTLMAATIIAYALTGDAYWYKVPSKGGKIAGLRWLSPWMTSPHVSKDRYSGTYIDAYVYKVGNDEKVIPKDQIVHFRDGLNLDDERTGWKRMEAVQTSVVSVNEGLVYTAAILENMGITPAIVTGTEGDALDDQAINYIQQALHGGSGGANRGRIVGLKLPVEFHEMGATPQGMALESILDRPISFICATLGVDPLVLGLSADRGTYENVGQARQMAWEDGIQPLLEAFADDMRSQLLPDFDGAEDLRLAWDYSKVPAMQEDQDSKVNRAVVAYQAGLCSLGTAQGLAGLPVTDEQDEVWFATATGGDPTEEPEEDPEAEPDPMDLDPEIEGEDDDDPFPASRSTGRVTPTGGSRRARDRRGVRPDAA